MADVTGRFIWYELLTTDTAAARAFYNRVTGWTAEDSGMSGMEYTLFKNGGKEVAGLMVQPEEAKQMGAPPAWLGYVGVRDVDATASQAAAKGGKVLGQPMDIPNVGRFAVIADPHGAVIGLFKTTTPDADQPQQQEGEGHIGWHELQAGDGPAAFDFYSGLFGWQKKEAMDMGPMGTYQMFGLGDVTMGGIMTKPADLPAPPHWRYFINVDSIDKAVERLKAAGGQVVWGPEEVPDSQFALTGQDPQGAYFALLGHR